MMNVLRLSLLFYFFSFYSFGCISVKEKNALLTFYEANNGASWVHAWNLNQPMSTWYGLVIIENIVVELNLPNNNLSGQIPVELGDLIHLIKIDFYKNAIKGTIPTTIGNLKNLRTLNLGFNQLSGEIPESLTKLKVLENL